MSEDEEIEDYTDFAHSVASQIAVEEADKFQEEMTRDQKELLDKWGKELLERVGNRMDALGIRQDLAITIDLPTPPVIKFTGAIYYGEADDE